MSIWLWLAFYIAVLVAIGAVTVYLRDRIVSDGPEAAKDQQSWEAWRQEAARQDGSHGPVQRAVPPSDEPPMRVLMRDHFGTILGASIIFPAIILGFLLIVLHGVLQQGSDGTPSELS
ncbi:MAG TPA: hypothetical protein VKB78_14340 [Pirellulales bacterium]|nr:hypothetical protein [Pirellulales bacterium]